MNLIHQVGKFIFVASISITNLYIYNTPAKAEERVCIMSDQGKPVCGKPIVKKEERKPSQGYGFQKDKYGRTFVVEGCRRSSEVVRCTVLIKTTKEKDILLVYGGYGNSSMVDSSGQIHKCYQMDIGGKVDGSYNIGTATGNESFIDFIFNDVPQQFTRASFLNIIVQNNGEGQHPVQFRNIPISN
jgi:hypothetical protein